MAPKIDQIKCRTVHFKYISGTIGIFINGDSSPRLITSFTDSRGDFTNLKSTLVWTEDDFLYNFISDYDAIIELPGWPITNPDSAPIQTALAIAPDFLDVYPGGSQIFFDEASDQFTFSADFGWMLGPSQNRRITSKELTVQHNFNGSDPYYLLFLTEDGTFVAGFKNFFPDGNNQLIRSAYTKTWEGESLDSIDNKLIVNSQTDLSIPLLYVELEGNLIRISRVGSSYQVVINKGGEESSMTFSSSSVFYTFRGIGSLQTRSGGQLSVDSFCRFIDWGSQIVTISYPNVGNGRVKILTATPPVTSYYLSADWSFLTIPPVIADGGKYYCIFSCKDAVIIMVSTSAFVTP